MNRALIAYEKAERFYEQIGKQNPSLHLNRGMAAKYMEDYELAMRSFRCANNLGAATGLSEAEKVYELVQRVSGAVERKVDLKAKHLKELLEDMKQGADGQRSLRDLRANVGSVDWPIAAKVVNILDRQDELPLIVICCDAYGEFFALSMYNANPCKVADAVVPMKTLIHIRQPKFLEVSINANHKTWSYPCVRVGHPGDVSVVGGSSLEGAAVCSKFSAAALPRKPQAEAEEVREDEGRSASHSSIEIETEVASQVDPKQERWIDEEDAKIKKEGAKAKSRAKAKLRAAKGKAKKQIRPNEQSAALMGQSEALNHIGKGHANSIATSIDSDAELETITGSESYEASENDGKNEKEAVEEVEQDTPEIALQKVRWSDLDESESDDDFVPRQVQLRAAGAPLPMTA